MDSRRDGFTTTFCMAGEGIRDIIQRLLVRCTPSDGCHEVMEGKHKCKLSEVGETYNDGASEWMQKSSKGIHKQALLCQRLWG